MDSSSYGEELSDDEPQQMSIAKQVEVESKTSVSIKNKQAYFGGLLRNQGITSFIEHHPDDVKRFSTQEFLDIYLGP